MAKTERIQNMTKGSPAKLIFTFAIPLMLGNVFQQFYTVVDTAIVGQALGVNALAALGAAAFPFTWRSVSARKTTRVLTVPLARRSRFRRSFQS